MAQNQPATRAAAGPLDRPQFTEAQATTIEQLGYSHIPVNHLQVFFARADELGLNPSNPSQIALIERNSRGGATYTLQIGIAGLRRGARKITKAEGGTYGEGEWLYRGIDKDGNPTDWQESWSVKRQGLPEAAKVIVTRDGAEFAHVVMWEEAVQTYKDGNPTPMWSSKPTFMLGKNAAAGAYRKAFPDEMSDLYVDSERFDSDDYGPVQARARRTDRPRGTGRAAILAAAQPAPRPAPDTPDAEDMTPAPAGRVYETVAADIVRAAQLDELNRLAATIDSAAAAGDLTTDEADDLWEKGRVRRDELLAGGDTK